jgi:hypothetical protein
VTAATTKGRPAATGRPFLTQSRGNGSQIDALTKREHTMHSNDTSAVNFTPDDHAIATEAPLPAWATEADEWHDESYDNPWRVVRRVVDIEGYEFQVDAVQRRDGTVEVDQVSLDSDLMGATLEDPLGALRKLAAFLVESADGIEAAR